MHYESDEAGLKDVERGVRIMHRMQELGYNNTDLADITGLSRQKITRILNGRNRYIDDIALVCVELDISLDFVCGISNELNQSKNEVMRKLFALPAPLSYQLVNLIEVMFYNSRGDLDNRRRRTDR